MNQLNQSPRVNCSLTRKIIALHCSGYVYDFLISADKQIMCLQNNSAFSLEHTLISVIYQGFDGLSQSYKYIHTVETECGYKGLFLGDVVIISNPLVN